MDNGLGKSSQSIQISTKKLFLIKCFFIYIYCQLTYHEMKNHDLETLNQ